MRTLKIASIILLNLMMIGVSSCSAFPDAKITLRVIDEDGKPVSGARAVVTFEGAEPFSGKPTNKTFSGLTDKDGLYSISSSTNTYAWYGVEINDCYESRGQYRFTKHESGKWLPWNPEIKVVMRRVANPVPMYVRDLHMATPEVEIPVLGKAVGFDLMEGDWVSPYGKGHLEDLTVKLIRRVHGHNDYEGSLEVAFPNKFNGIQVHKDDRNNASIFKLPRFAPEEGYQRQITHFIERKGVGNFKSDFKDDNNYFFRVRSEEKDGKLWRAMYGKILGDIKFYLTKETATIEFKYFLNPDYTRNLEYNHKNLLKLPDREVQPN